jgi:site-specific DNA recombinase
MYYGLRAYNRFPKNELAGRPRGERNPASEWVVKEEAHPGIVAKDLFDQANSVRTWKFAVGSRRAVQSTSILSGFIRCSRCGFSDNGYSRRGKQLRYYADSGFLAKGRSVCSWHVIPREPLERFVIDAIREPLLIHVLRVSWRIS